MNSRWPLLALGCAVCPQLIGAQVDSASIREVLAAEDRRFAAMAHADTGALAPLLASELTYTHTDGAQNTRAEFLRIVGSGALKYVSIAPEAREVRVFTSTAVVTGRSRMRVDAEGQTHAFGIRYLAVYRHSTRGWELVAWQSTRLPT